MSQMDIDTISEELDNIVGAIRSVRGLLSELKPPLSYHPPGVASTVPAVWDAVAHADGRTVLLTLGGELRGSMTVEQAWQLLTSLSAAANACGIPACISRGDAP